MSTTTVSQLEDVAVHRVTRAEFRMMEDAGGLRTELLQGVIVDVAPPSPEHSAITHRLARQLRVAFDEDQYWIRVEQPIAADEHSQPQPDVSVVVGSDRHWVNADDHPSDASLVIEVSKTTLHLDRAKAAIYARAGVPEYVIVNLVDRVLEVHREPRDDAYQSVVTLDENAEWAPLRAANPVALRVGDLLA